MNRIREKTCPFCKKEKGILSTFGVVRFYKNCLCEKAVEEREKEARAIESQEKEKEKRVFRSIIAESGLFTEERSMSFSNYQENEDNKQALHKCRLYVKHFKEYEKDGVGLFIIGGVGIGKTHLSVASSVLIAKNYLTRFLFVTAIDLIEKRKSYRDLVETALLVLDDLGTENSSEYSVEKIYSVINRRYRAKRPTIITTNLTRKELLERYKLRFMSRLSRNGEISFKGKDQRLSQ